MTDSFRHKGLRKQLVEELKGKGIKNSKVLEALNTIPRHLFIDNARPLPNLPEPIGS